MKTEKLKSIKGSILGTAIGDALGLPCEGLSRKRLKKMYPDLGKYHFLFNKGMVSDDTEHTCMVSQTILEAEGDTQKFGELLSKKFRLWLLGLPAGIGLATLKSILKLWIGFSYKKSGIFSAGNGPAMRSAILGVCYGNNPEIMKEYVKISTRITHTDPKAEYGSLAVALAAHMSSENNCSPEEYLENLTNLLPTEASEFIELIKKVIKSIQDNQSTEDFAQDLGLGKGITGYIYHTVPVVIHCWFRNPSDLQKGLKEIIACGGDADTTAAILGGIIGAAVGKEGIPDEWINNFVEYPRKIFWMEMLSERLASYMETSVSKGPLEISFIAIFIRNIFFLIIVLLHGFRRLLPPYLFLK